MNALHVMVIGLMMLIGCSTGKDSNTFSGTVELTEHVLGAKTAGRISTLLVNEGDMVKAKQVVATLDRYEQTTKDYNRAQELLTHGGGDAQAVEYAQLAMEDQQVVSPTDGIILVKAAELGETVSAGAGIVVVGDIQDQWVRIFVPEGQMSHIHLNQQVTISLDGSKTKYEGHVSFISPRAEFTPRNIQTKEERVTQAFAVKVAFDHPDEHLHPGVAADITFNERI